MREDELIQIEARYNKATEGPWIAYIEGRDHTSGCSFIKTKEEDIELTGATEDDYDFIAHARQDVPILVNEIRRLIKILEKKESGATSSLEQD